jgi:hypothetical protein
MKQDIKNKALTCPCGTNNPSGATTCSGCKKNILFTP